MARPFWGQGSVLGSAPIFCEGMKVSNPARESSVESRTEACPCGSGLALAECCGPLLAGTEARTAEALMRSRYTAYALGDVDYILRSHDPDTVGEVDRKNTELWSKSSQWLGLEVHAVDQGGEQDQAGSVEFSARYKVKGVAIQHRERARFKRHGGRWVFVDGEEIAGPPIRNTAPKVGRNDPCPCGSGKKYKKCHGLE
jgi:SEC-C motif domain protein